MTINAILPALAQRPTLARGKCFACAVGTNVLCSMNKKIMHVLYRVLAEEYSPNVCNILQGDMTVPRRLQWWMSAILV